METIDSIANRISELVQGAKGQQITGAQLAPLLKFYFPEFTSIKYACRNLRDFITKFVPSVVVVGQAGADLIYGPAARQAFQLLPSQPESGGAVNESAELDYSTWRTFTSPRGVYKLFGHPSTGELKVAGSGEPAPGPPWKEVPPCPAHRHLEIAREFVGSLSDTSHRDLLTRTFSQEQRWYPLYMSNIQQLGLALRWSDFRRRKLFDEMRGCFERLGIPFKFARPPSTSRSYATLNRRHEATARVAREGSPEEQLRRVAVEVVQGMSLAELRNLTVRLGSVVDALNR